MDDFLYEMCGDEFCYHFIEDNPDDGFAAYIHLDDGDKEYDHDAIPSGQIHKLSWWRMAWPQLFLTFPDGKIGPNSKHFLG